MTFGPGKTFPFGKSATLLDLALAKRVRIKYDCKVGDCGKCRVEITSGAEHLNPRTPSGRQGAAHDRARRAREAAWRVWSERRQRAGLRAGAEIGVIDALARGRARRLCAAFSCLVLGAILLCPAIPLDATGEHAASPDPLSSGVCWLGWRGVTNEGRSSASLPLKWDANAGIVWKVAIPGTGHSSPIVDADRVYVSTSYPQNVGVLAGLLDAVAVGLATLLVILTTHRIVQMSEPGALSRTSLLIRTSAAAALALTLFAIGWLGEGLFDFPRCDIRGWLGSASFSTLACAVAVLHAQSRAGRLLGCATAIALAVVVGIGIPSRDHAFRGGVLALNAQVVFTTVAMPLALACIIGWQHISWSGKRRFAVIVALVAGLASAALVRHLLVFRNGTSARDHLSAQDTGLACLGDRSPAAWAIYAARVKTRATTIGSAVGLSILLLLGIIAIGEQLAARSNYLAYHIGTSRLVMRFGGAAALAAACSLIVAHGFAVAMGFGSRSANKRRQRLLAPSLSISALLLALVFFVRVNYVHAEGQLVRVVVAIDRMTGVVRWISPGLAGPREVVDGRNSPATPTPVSDGERICAYFGNPGVMCLDRQGRLLWSRTDVGYTGFYGVGFSPVLAEGLLVLASDSAQGIAVVHAFDVRTGTLVWRRTIPTLAAVSGNNRTPIVKTIGGQATLILWGRDYLKGLRLRTGDDAWHYPVQPGGDLVSSLVSDNTRLYLSDVTGSLAIRMSALAEGRDSREWRSPARELRVAGALRTSADYRHGHRHRNGTGR